MCVCLHVTMCTCLSRTILLGPHQCTMQYQADQHLQYMTTRTQAGNLSLSNRMHDLSNNTYIRTLLVTVKGMVALAPQ